MESDSYSDTPGAASSLAGLMSISKLASRGASTDPEAGPSSALYGAPSGPATPAGSEGDEPAELDMDDMDPINSGAVTPALVPEAAPVKRSKALNFLKKKETKVRLERLCLGVGAFAGS